MTDLPAISARVYRVGHERESILDLLRRFADPAFHLDGISRLSDLPHE